MRKSRLAEAHDDDGWPNGTSHRHGAGGVLVDDDDEKKRFSDGTAAEAGDGNRLHDRRSLTAATDSEP